MYDDLVKRLRRYVEIERSEHHGAELEEEAADAIEERDRYALTLQHEMMAEAESHIALVERLNKRIEELELHYCPHAIRNVHDRGDDSLCEKHKCEVTALSRWIPVTERLPENDCHVLAYYGFNRGDGYLGMMFMQVLDYYARDPRPHFQHEGLNGMTVTHWMPLPESPKEET